MKKSVLRIGILLMLIPAFASALDINTAFEFSSINFNTADTTPLGAVPDSFEPRFGSAGSIELQDNISDTIRYSVRVARDAVLRNLVSADISYSTSFVTVSLGPYFGAFNSPTSTIKPGLSTAIRFDIPGVAFLSFGADATLSASLEAANEYGQESSEIEAGIWLPNMLLTARIASRSFKYRMNATLLTKDERLRYEVLFDVYKKAVPFRLCIITAYQEAARRYMDTADDDTDRLHLLIAGLRLTMQLSNQVQFVIGGEGALYSWASGGMTGPAPNAILFDTTFALRVNLDKALTPDIVLKPARRN